MLKPSSYPKRTTATRQSVFAGAGGACRRTPRRLKFQLPNLGLLVGGRNPL